MINKLKANWLSIALTIVVIISLFLSGLIWTNPYQYEGARRENVMKSSQQYTAQSMGDVYLPTTVVRTNGRGNQVFLYSTPASLTREMKNIIRGWQFGRVTTVKSNNSDVYLSYLRRHNAITLSYPKAIPTLVFNETFSQTVNSDQVSQINHIVIPLKGPREVYLLSDHRYGIYRLQVKKGNFKQITKLTKGARGIAVDHKIVNGTTMLTYPKSFTLPVFAFQVANQNIDTLSSNLLSSNQRSNITSSENGDEVVYSSGNNQRLVYHRTNGTVDYESFTNSDDHRSTDQLYSYFYNRLVKTGVQLSNVRFDGTSNHQRRFTYRTFVDGFPIFNEDGYGSIQLMAGSGTERCQMSRYSLQVPLPINQQEVKLPATPEVLNDLHASPHFRDIKGIRVGYLWRSDDSNKVVKLTPTYFVWYHGNWVDYEQLLK